MPRNTVTINGRTYKTLTQRKSMRNVNLFRALNSAGISDIDIFGLLRIEKTLGRWAERECNGELDRDEKDNKTYRVYYSQIGDARRYRVADKETGALKRLRRIMSSYPTLQWYHQTDPRGCALYIIRPGDVPAGADMGSYYSRGIAVCVD